MIKPHFFLSATLVFYVVLALASLSVSAAERRVLVLNDTNEPPFTTAQGDGFIDIVATEAFRRAGAELRLVKLPAERGLINANNGLEDGDLTRIAGLEQQYPNLMQVPEKLMDWEFTAFSKNADIAASWAAIRQHSVGHIKGWKIYEKNMAGAEQVITADDPDQLFQLLGHNRVEVALYARWMGQAYLKQQHMQGVHALEPPLATREMFIYLHKRHAELIPKITEALRALKREGFYQRIQRVKLQPYRQTASP
jgi:polar amino acid transport system substrate-binding protein